jgi:hypothetical protein
MNLRLKFVVAVALALSSCWLKTAIAQPAPTPIFHFDFSGAAGNMKLRIRQETSNVFQRRRRFLFKKIL